MFNSERELKRLAYEIELLSRKQKIIAGTQLIEFGAVADHTDPNTISQDVNAMDWTGHQYADGTALSIERNYVVTFGNNASIAYSWIGPKPVTVGLGGDYVATDADFMAVGTGDHSILINRDLPDSHPISAITSLQDGLDLKAPLASPAFTGNPTAPTATLGDNDTSIATTEFATITADGKVEWRNTWLLDIYPKNIMVRDGAYAMISNKETSDRAAPQDVGSPRYLYTGSLLPYEQQAKQIIFGTRYLAGTALKLTGYRVDVVSGNKYEVYLVTGIGPDPVLTKVSDFTANTDGWVNIPGNDILIGNGFTFDLMALVHEPAVTPVIVTHNYNYQTPNNVGTPGNGVMMQADKELEMLHVSKIDDDGLDNTVIVSYSVGDVIELDTVRWTVQSVEDNGTYMSFQVSPAVQYSSNGVEPVNFESTASTPITVGYELNYNQSTPNSGLYIVDGRYLDIVPDDNQYGIDIEVQEISISDDWDLVATSKRTGSGADEIPTSGLERVLEGSKVGWRFIGADADQYGDTGAGAVNLSSSTLLSSEAGSIGDYSLASGLNTIAKNTGSVAAGKYNVGTSTETIHETGIGDGTTSKNAFEIYTDGRVRAPELSIPLNDDDRSLVTTEYMGDKAYLRDGSKAITSSFQAGGFALSDIQNGVDDQDAVSLGQMSTSFELGVYRL